MKPHGEMSWTSGLIPMIEPDAVSEIISRISDIALVLSPAGIVLGVLSNPGFRSRLGLSRWEGEPLRDLLTVESVKKLDQRLEEFLDSDTGAVRAVELNHSASGDLPEFPVRYSFHNIGSGDSILLLGQDLRPVAEMQQQLVAAQIALEKDHEAQRAYATRLRVLMAEMDEGTLFVSADNGQIIDCNPAASAVLGRPRNDLVGSALADHVQVESDGTLLDTLCQRANASKSASVTAQSRAGGTFALRPTLFRTAGAQVLLCRLGKPDSMTPVADRLTQQLETLYEAGPDAMVFVTQGDIILSANEAFLRLTNVAQNAALKDRQITDFLGRCGVDINVMRENAARTGTMRMYATRIISEHGTEVPVEISTTYINTGSEPVFALVIRDASRAEAVRNAGGQITDVDMRSVVELIGSNTLKGIVAKTTDVIEKMCIETAVELTSNNRVAAAEMLGLSRQSFYVKLRKYNLLKKEG